MICLTRAFFVCGCTVLLGGIANGHRMLGAMIAPVVVLHIDERMKPVHRRGERHYMNAVDILHAFMMLRMFTRPKR